MSINLFRALLPLLALAAAACDGTSGPSGVEGRYSVHSVNGQPPPAAVTSSPSGSVIQVVDARLELDAPNATIEVETRMVGDNGATGESIRTTYSGTYQASGDVITFSGLQSSPPGIGVTAQGVVVSPREVVVTLHVSVASSSGFFTYPISLIMRR